MSKSSLLHSDMAIKNNTHTYTADRGYSDAFQESRGVASLLKSSLSQKASFVGVGTQNPVIVSIKVPYKWLVRKSWPAPSHSEARRQQDQRVTFKCTEKFHGIDSTYRTEWNFPTRQRRVLLYSDVGVPPSGINWCKCLRRWV